MRLVRVLEQLVRVRVIETAFRFGIVDSRLENVTAFFSSLFRGENPDSFCAARIVGFEVTKVGLSAAVGHDPYLVLFRLVHVLGLAAKVTGIAVPGNSLEVVKTGT